MDKTTAACVDPYVIDSAATDVVASPEKHNITRQHGVQRDWARRALLLVGGAWDLQPRALVYISHESAAIETLLIRAAEMVGRSDQLSRCSSDRGPTIIATLWRMRTADAATYQAHQKERQPAAQVTAKRVSHASNPLDQLTAQAVLATRVILPAAPSYRKPAQRSRDGVSRGLDIRKPAMQHRSSVDSQAPYLPCMISRHTILQGVENC